MSDRPKSLSVPRWQVFRLFLAAFGLVSVLLVLIGLPIYREYEAGIERTVIEHERVLIHTASQMFSKELSERIDDLHFMANLPALNQYLKTGSAADRQRLASYFQDLAQASGSYDQVRLLDARGKELIRINLAGGQAVQAAQRDLQDKSDRYYFQRSFPLNAGQVYVSPLDLNVEHGKVERPYKPVIRFATPVFDAQGNKRGALVLNFLAKGMLSSFSHEGTEHPGIKPMLLSKDGFWISTPDRELEWGADLQQPQHNFAVVHPDIWPRIQAHHSGVIKSKTGIFLFSRTEPLNFAQTPLPLIRSTDKLSVSTDSVLNWITVLWIPRSIIDAASLFRQPAGIWVLSFMVLLLGALVFLLALRFLQARTRREYERRIQAEITDLYENAPCGYLSVNPQGLVIRINRTKLKWLGYTSDDVLGKPFTNILTESSAQKFNDCFSTFVSDGDTYQCDLDMRRSNGTILPVSVTSVAVRNSKGHLLNARFSAVDITDRLELQQKMEILALTDALTGLGNRRQFGEKAAQMFLETKRESRPLALFILDVDHFKRINDTYGHDTGDVALKILADTANQCLDSSALFSRYGGEEFVGILPGTPSAAALQIMNQLRERLAQAPVELTNGETIHFTVSIGVSALEEGDTHLEQLIKRADIALYEAKGAGRNNVQYGAST